MKKYLKRIAICMLSLLTAGCCLVGCDKKEEESGAAKPPADLFFSFESVDELFRTVLKVYDRVGIYGVSDEHVTQGNKSMKVEVIGTYTQNSRPGMDLYCQNSAFLSCDVSIYKEIAMDVYNANSKDLSISTYFNVNSLSDPNTSINTDVQTFVLKANSATTVKIKVPDIEATYNLKNVNYMHLEFHESKKNAEDPANVFYFDNIRGVK